MDRLFRRASFLTLALIVAACGKAPNEEAALADLDNSLAQVNGASSANDPALQGALKDQIMVDPALVQQANADTVRPPAQPESGAVPPEGIADAARKPVKDEVRPAPPASGDCKQCAAARRALTLGALAASQGASAQCAANVAYSNDWANRLPQGVPLYPDARVAEAAGADRDGCALRVVSFTSAAPMQRLLDWYYTRTSDAGYRAEHQAEGNEHILGGTKRGAAFLLVLNPRKGGGTDVDLMADGG
ncbi:hypothetical protein [Sphingomonas radiodurans]|uniref:hypothetical protein n=1 Tax=Sphingomonas radiodurans TaxID=2890321 RepID=UPI001E50AFCB|nr:hypothetical protein [Sphingomonas radiodurans]WBH16888.1 hypothetical protein LLW23_01845 [Sphingomonas radiodurans]